jgi:bacterial/archaeal transporter family protein
MDWRILIAVTVLSWGGYNVLLKWAGGQMAWQASMLLFVVAYALAVGVYCLVQGPWDHGDLMTRKAAAPIISGILCAVGAVAFFKALPVAPGSVLMPLVGLYPVVAAIGCLVVFREAISPRLVAGIVCASLAMVLLGR